MDWLSCETIAGSWGYPWEAKKKARKIDCWRLLARATSSAWHEEVVLIFCMVDLEYSTPLPSEMHTPERDFPEEIGLKDESMDVWTCTGKVHPSCKEIPLVDPRYWSTRVSLPQSSSVGKRTLPARKDSEVSMSCRVRVEMNINLATAEWKMTFNRS